VKDTSQCNKIPYFDILKEDGSEITIQDKEMYAMLDLEKRKKLITGYKSLKFNTDVLTEGREKVKKYTFGIRAGHQSKVTGYPTKLVKVIVSV
jgi:hypothetical protein